MKRQLSLLLGLFVATLTANVYAQSLSVDKTYTICNNNDPTMFMQDNGTGGVELSAKNNNAYWKFVPTQNADCYYIQNASSGKYIQGYDGSEQEVAMGDTGVEYFVKADASGNLEGKFRMSCTVNTPYDFSDGTLGLNWKNNNTVQSFASVTGGNPRSAWIVSEEEIPETQPVIVPMFDANKTYSIECNNQAGKYMQDNGIGYIVPAALNSNSYWLFEATANEGCYYVKNATTGLYMQTTSEYEVSVKTGSEPVEIFIKNDPAKGEDVFGLASTDREPHDFANDNTYGANYTADYVQGFSAMLGGRPNSFWKIVEAEMPEPVEPEPVAQLSSPWIGSELAEGEFYLYNVTSGLWLQNNDSKSNDWSTRAAIGTRGLDFVLAGNNGNYTIGGKFGSTSINPDNNYLDTGNNPAWTFTAVDVEGVSNAYKINNDWHVMGTVKYNEGNRQDNLFTQTGDERWYLENDPYNYADNVSGRDIWQLVTKEERLAKMQAEASPENPVDASWLIPSADFANNDQRINLWTRSFGGGNNPRGGDENYDHSRGSMCQESWNSSYIDFSITLDVPNGTYRFNLQGYYRDGGFEDVLNRRNAGNETIRSFYFANEQEKPLKSILDEAKTESGILGFERENGGFYYPDALTSANRCFNKNKAYVNEEIEVVVTTGKLKIGIKKNEKSESDWTVFDNFKLTYLGNNIDISDYVYALTAAIDAAEAFDASTTSAVLAGELADAVAAGKAALSSTNADELSAAAGAINTALEAARAVNVVVLRQTFALAKAEVTNKELDEGLVDDVRTTAELDFNLFLLQTVRKINAQSMEDIYTGSVPEADGEYFLYNIGTGMWMNHGSDWNTHAAVDVYPLPVKLIAADDGKFKMQTHMFKNRDEKWINWNTYVDTGDQDTWTFNPVEGKENVYTINSEGNRTDVGRLFGYDPFGPTDKGNYWYWSNVTKDRFGVEDTNNQWKLVTRAEIEALAEQASEANPVDVSYLIENGGLSRVWSLDMYTKVCDGGNGGAHITSGDDNNFDRNSDYGYEVWNANSFSFTQELNGLKPGVYEVSVNGFFRQGDGGFQADVVNQGGELISEAYLVANGEMANLPNIATEAGKLPGIFSQDCVNGTFANWPREALAAFETGLYGGTKVKCVVGFDGKLTFGVKQDQKTTDASWVLFDTFRLTYLGPVQIETMSILGDFTGGWELEDAVTMLQNIDNPNIWTLEIEDFEVTLEEGQTERKYEFKATANNVWGAYELPAQGNQDWVFGSDAYPAGIYDLVFTVDTEKHELTLDPIYDATTTGIADVNREATTNNLYYNLNGQRLQVGASAGMRVTGSNKGVYIVNGKKIIMK